jgi:tripartite-type tricarboxylate transporter receptor subunit TctC
VIENKPGGGTGRHRIRRQVRARRLHAAGNADATFVTSPHTYSKLPYDPINDFVADHRPRHQPAGAGRASVAAGAHARRPCRLRQKKPGELNYGTFGIGSSGHLNIVLLEGMTGTKFTPVHYRGAAPRSPTSSAAHPDDDREHRAGGAAVAIRRAQRAGFGSTARIAQYPAVPTLAEKRAAGLRSRVW